MASLFTSLPARSHGVVRGFFWDGEVIDQDVLSDDLDTLAEVLRGRGYSTFGVSTNGHLWRRTGFGQGFDTFIELPWEPVESANHHALGLRRQLDSAAPYFLWVHYFDPHAPYEGREPWYSRFKAEQHPVEIDPEEKPIEVPEDVSIGALEALADIHDRYDSEVGRVDDGIRDLFEGLDLGPEAVVVVTSDHGEAFFEHGELGHGTSLFREEIQVPLLVHASGQQVARRVDAPVSLIDVYPTILDLLGIDPPAGLAGVSLADLLENGDLSDRVIVSQLSRGGKPGAHTAVQWNGWKAHFFADRDTPALLFDLGADPGQEIDLAWDQPVRMRQLRKHMREWRDKWPRRKAARKVAPFTAEEDRERLRQLGYLD